MKISNKLNSADFIQLQKIVMERYEPDKTTIILLRYLSNFLYAGVVALGAYFILLRLTGVSNLMIPVILGILTFALLVWFFPKIFRRRMIKTIEKFYSRSHIDIQRELLLDEEGFTVMEKKGEKRFAWTDFEAVVHSGGNYFLKRKNQAEGYIIKADHLGAEEIRELETYLTRIDKTIEYKTAGGKKNE